MTRPALRVVVDARLAPGQSGGVEGVVTGLASGLSALTDASEEYLFVVWRDLGEWLRPHIAGNAQLIEQALPSSGTGPLESLRGRVRAARRTIGKRAKRSAGEAATEPPRTDRFVEHLHPDVVHFPFQRGSLTSAPNIYHPHDLQHVHLPEFFTEQERAWRELWYGTLARQATMVAAASTWTKVDIETHFRLEPGRVRVVPLAPPLAVAIAPSEAAVNDLARRLALPAAYVLYPAQTWPHKNHRGLIEALAILRDRDGIKVSLVATGAQNEYFSELQRLISELGLSEQVVWTGFLEPSELKGVYERARAVVVPSKFEAASAPLWEAFLAGIPAACSNVTALPRQAGDAALVFDPDDFGAIADATRTLWTDDGVRRRLIERGRNRVAEFSWDRTAHLFRAHYRRLAGGPLDDEEVALLAAEPAL